MVFILNASRRLFSDRFFVELPPGIYSTLTELGQEQRPRSEQMEEGAPNGHRQQVLLKRVLLRTMPELAPELQRVVNAFDPGRAIAASIRWSGSREKGAESDEAFKSAKK